MKKAIQLPVQTITLVIGFMVWVILFGLIPYIKEDIVLTANQLTFVTAIPVVLGSILRVPIGYWTNRYGARNVGLISFILLLFPIFYISIANTLTDLLIGGLFIGVGGAIFSVGVTSLPKYYPKESHGFVNGIYGMRKSRNSRFYICSTDFGYNLDGPLLFRSLSSLAVVVLLNFFLGIKRNQE